VTIGRVVCGVEGVGGVVGVWDVEGEPTVDSGYVIIGETETKGGYDCS